MVQPSVKGKITMTPYAVFGTLLVNARASEFLYREVIRHGDAFLKSLVIYYQCIFLVAERRSG